MDQQSQPRERETNIALWWKQAKWKQAGNLVPFSSSIFRTLQRFPMRLKPTTFPGLQHAKKETLSFVLLHFFPLVAGKKESYKKVKKSLTTFGRSVGLDVESGDQDEWMNLFYPPSSISYIRIAVESTADRRYHESTKCKNVTKKRLFFTTNDPKRGTS